MKSYYWFGVYLLLGLWLVISPYALAFVEVRLAYWNAIGSGALAMLIALVGLYLEREESEGHHITHGSHKTA